MAPFFTGADIGYMFAVKMVWPPDRFPDSVLVYLVPQVNGANIPIDGTVMRPEIAIVYMQIVNGSGDDYNDLRLQISTDLWILDVFQMTTHTECEKQRGGEVPSTFVFSQDGVPKYGAHPKAQTKTWSVYCRQLRAGDRLELLLTTVSSGPVFTLNGEPAPLQPMKPPKQVKLEASYKGKFSRPRHWPLTKDIKELGR